MDNHGCEIIIPTPYTKTNTKKDTKTIYDLKITSKGEKEGKKKEKKRQRKMRNIIIILIKQKEMKPIWQTQVTEQGGKMIYDLFTWFLQLRFVVGAFRWRQRGWFGLKREPETAIADLADAIFQSESGMRILCLFAIQRGDLKVYIVGE